MLEDLGKLIQVIQNNYERICSMWDSTNQNAFSLKKELVCDSNHYRQSSIELQKLISS